MGIPSYEMLPVNACGFAYISPRKGGLKLCGVAQSGSIMQEQTHILDPLIVTTYQAGFEFLAIESMIFHWPTHAKCLA